MIQFCKEMYLRYEEIVLYLIVGILTTIVSLGVYYGCVFTFLNPENPLELQCANIISWVAAVTFAYFLNRKVVFKSSNKNYVAEAAKFYSSRVITLIMDMVIMFLMVTMLGLNDKIAKIVVQVVVTVGNYVFSKWLVFHG